MRWILLCWAVVISCDSIPANAVPKEILRPNGVPPEFALLRSSGGKFILSRVVTKTVFETQRSIDANGKPKPISRQTARIVSENRTEEAPIEEFDVYTLSPPSVILSAVKNLSATKLRTHGLRGVVASATTENRSRAALPRCRRPHLLQN